MKAACHCNNAPTTDDATPGSSAQREPTLGRHGPRMNRSTDDRLQCSSHTENLRTRGQHRSRGPMADVLLLARSLSMAAMLISNSSPGHRWRLNCPIKVARCGANFLQMSAAWLNRRRPSGGRNRAYERHGKLRWRGRYFPTGSFIALAMYSCERRREFVRIPSNRRTIRCVQRRRRAAFSLSRPLDKKSTRISN